jgi:hypothetical protein
MVVRLGASLGQVERSEDLHDLLVRLHVLLLGGCVLKHAHHSGEKRPGGGLPGQRSIGQADSMAPPRSSRGRQRSVLWPSPFRISGPPTGDARNEWGHVRSAGNGTSGRSVAERVLRLSESSRTRRGSPMPSTGTLLSPAGPPGSRPTPSGPTMRPSRPAAALPSAEAARPPGARRARETRGHLAPDAPPLGSRGGRRANHRNPRRRGPAGPLGHRGRGHRTADPAPRRAKAGRRSGPLRRAGDCTVGPLTTRWHALVHPGQRSRAWAALHDGWRQRQKSGGRRTT